ncbi:hypothetical protein L6164_019867 [Bauhinia variegata]|uniref:Uncharacterized protein n=1 Tax=Bauhinia variegata TaxID=167791 RepID=A0ACB9MTK9_BAUVA|nr:hypothetical protein L6164_019867 [Bauhinia variegata]
MGTLQYHRIDHISLFPLFLLNLYISSLQFLSLAYIVPDKYFINCGSDSNATEPDGVGPVFAGESYAGSLGFSFPKRGGTDKQTNNSSLVPPLYQTARTFQRKSSYKFSVDNHGIYLVRLHFFAFSSPIDLSKALFNVSVSRFWLLNNFSAPNSKNTASVKEFSIYINSSSFIITFTPLGSSFAFINAIELFPLPGNFIPDKATRVNPRGNSSNYTAILSLILQTNFRLNVGGSNITRRNDYLWRSWESDDAYLSNPKKAESNSSQSKVHYEKNDDSGGPVATKYIAPDIVYQTAKVTSGSLNITWELRLKRNSVHLVRLHFCDMFSSSVNLTAFNLLINNKFITKINSYDVSDQLSVPFYYDFVVDSDDSGIMIIVIKPREDSSFQNAFLNGLEVMEIMNTKGPIADDGDEQSIKNHLFLELGLSLGAFSLICILVVGFILRLKLRKPKPVENSDWVPVPVKGGGSSHSRRSSSHGSNLNLGLKISFREIQLATKNFNAKRVIGKGGFGTVYKGVLQNGPTVAVKRREQGSEGQGLLEFQTEIIILSKIRHRHLVSLIGYCDEMSEMILVYEYMEKGTLRDHLYNSNVPSLSWKERLEICIGAARGLNYLHKGSAGGIIHRDVKSTNILLDENHVAKVADFGLSRTGSIENQSYVFTVVKGTFGYLDPEYFRSQQLTDKSDVYSFGVVLLEVLCARPAIDPNLPRDQANLAEWGMLCKNKGTLEEIIDPSIKCQIDIKSLRKFSETVEKCLQENGSDRPNMGDVIWDLEYALQLQRGAIDRKQHQDSSSGASASLQLANIRCLPSLSSLDESDDIAIMRDYESDSCANLVFSQLKIDDAR